jgi:hypothetical protein
VPRRPASAVLLALALLAAGGCGGGSTSSQPPAPAPANPPVAPAGSGSAATPVARCRRVPRTTVGLIASHANARTRFSLRSAAAVDAGRGYAVSVAAVAGGTRRVGTWFVDDLRAPETVTSGNVQALEVTNWPLESLADDPAGQSRNCATKNLRGRAPR